MTLLHNENKDRTRTHSQKQKVKNNFVDGSFSLDSDKISSNETDITKINDKIISSTSTRVSFSDITKHDVYLDKNKQRKNKRDENSKKTNATANDSRNKYGQNNWKSKQGSRRNKKRNFILNDRLYGSNIFTVKYRAVRTPGCWRPTFMFINRSSHAGAITLRDSIISRMSYLILASKYDQIMYHKVKNNDAQQIVSGNNYSLI